MKRDVLLPLRRFHGWLHDWPENNTEKQQLRATFVRPIKKKLRTKPETVFLVLTPTHSNLGDHAIAFAETTMLDRIGVPYIEIPGSQLELLRKHKLLSFMNGSPILINGGGNMGTLWYGAERLHRMIISSNPKSPIFILPNTVFYEDSIWGNQELQDSIRIYNKHPDLHLYARERESYSFMQQHYEQVSLSPDMVLSLSQFITQKERKGCLICLRNDLEKTVSDDDRTQLIDQVAAIFVDNIAYTDTCIGRTIPVEMRSYELNAKFAEFSSARLVVTDRLHGMIFCAITGTPCIVVNSKSPKVRGCYEWIKHLDYIKFAEDVSQIAELYSQIPSGEYHYDNTVFQDYFDDLSGEILKAVDSVRR